MLPSRLTSEIRAKLDAGWSGTITLNLKDGSIVAYEVTEKTRIDRETHVSLGRLRAKGRAHSNGKQF